MTSTADLYNQLEGLLNPEQLLATTTTEGPLLILAGAGSGKTRVLVHRVYYLLESGRAKPWQIFCVTFTNKAANEMRTRLEGLLGEQIGDAWIGTFHSLAARMLRMEGHRLGYSRYFTIYDADDSKRLIKRIMNEMGIDRAFREASVSEVGSQIDRAKNNGLSAKAFAEQASQYDPPAKKIAKAVFFKYERALRRSDAMDFGDLLLLAAELFRHHPEVRDRFSRRFRYVAVDEFQDTNAVQYELLRRLVGAHRNLAVVGDDDQSIYRWRGAEVSNILGFTEHFPKATVVKLEKNYRSTKTILAAANAVISHNKNRHEKNLWTDAAEGPPVGLAMVNHAEEEAALVAQTIKKRLDEGASPTSFAILYRQNAQSRLFEEMLRRARIPFTLIGGVGFYERREVKDILAYLRLTANPSSREDFERVINTPNRGIGDKTVERLRKAAEEAEVEGAGLLALPDEKLLAAGLKAAAIKKLRTLDEMLVGFRELSKDVSARQVAEDVVQQIDYLEYLERMDATSAEDRAANVAELVTSIADFERSIPWVPVRQSPLREETLRAELAEAEMQAETEEYQPPTPLHAFLDQAALSTADDRQNSEGSVSLLTLHSAKGLEFPCVFMVGMEEETFPNKRSLSEDPEALEEERRLCYVGMTRAQKELVLLAARFRSIYGQVEVRRPSRFLGELPNEVVGNLSFPGQPRPSRPQYRKQAYAPRSSEIARSSDITLPDESDFRPGTRVFHNTFGVGMVTERDGVGRKARLTIRFSEAGERKVLARFVRQEGE